jgi:methyl-accepting chemotaxis protein
VDFNDAIAALAAAMRTISSTAGSLGGSSREIAGAASELAQRTERQSASLGETATALDAITKTVRRSADGARQAAQIVAAARTQADQSNTVVDDAIRAVGDIKASSVQISQIVGVIDEIAFQTNLLALNAGVEAARAGDSGRGFAVVAQEVRALAQRSAEAAKEIKALISASTQQVTTGVDLVARTGDALQNIVAKVNEIDALVAGIAASAHEQAMGLDNVNSAVTQMDHIVQQNAAMVEETTAAAQLMKSDAGTLAGLMRQFQVSAADGPQRRPEPALGRSALRRAV